MRKNRKPPCPAVNGFRVPLPVRFIYDAMFGTTKNRTIAPIAAANSPTVVGPFFAAVLGRRSTNSPIEPTDQSARNSDQPPMNLQARERRGTGSGVVESFRYV